MDVAQHAIPMQMKLMFYNAVIAALFTMHCVKHKRRFAAKPFCLCVQEKQKQQLHLCMHSYIIRGKNQEASSINAQVGELKEAIQGLTSDFREFKTEAKSTSSSSKTSCPDNKSCADTVKHSSTNFKSSLCEVERTTN